MFNLTRMDLEKIFRKQPVPQNKVRLEFMTLEQIEERNKRALARAHRNLQMPPILQVSLSQRHLIQPLAHVFINY